MNKLIKAKIHVTKKIKGYSCNIFLKNLLNYYELMN